MTERFEIFPQNVTKDGTLIIIQKGLKLYNINDVVDLLNTLHEENEQLKQFQEKVFDLINDEIHKSEEEYNHAVKSGMPSNSTYENIGLLEYLKEELEK